MNETVKLAYLSAGNKLFIVIVGLIITLLILNRIGTWFVLPRKSRKELESFVLDERKLTGENIGESGTFFYAMHQLFTNQLSWVTKGALERRFEEVSND